MYEAHWGLGETPFHDQRFFYRSPTHDEAIARLRFLIERRRQLGLLLGPAGSGKTLVLDVLSRELQASGCRVVSGNLLTLDGQEFLWELAHQLHCRPHAGSTVHTLWRAIVDRLTENRYQRVTTVMLFDDASDASRAVLNHIVRLLHLGSDPEARLTIILAADIRSWKQLGQRIVDLSALRIELDPWDPQEIVSYLQSLLSRAGAREQVFDQAVAERLHALSGGIPRRICHLAELALAAGAGQELPRIDVETIDAVYQEASFAH